MFTHALKTSSTVATDVYVARALLSREGVLKCHYLQDLEWIPVYPQNSLLQPNSSLQKIRCFQQLFYYPSISTFGALLLHQTPFNHLPINVSFWQHFPTFMTFLRGFRMLFAVLVSQESPVWVFSNMRLHHTPNILYIIIHFPYLRKMQKGIQFPNTLDPAELEDMTYYL